MKPRHHLYLDDELTAQREALAAKPGSSKSAIVADALRQYLALRGAHDIDEALKIRLDRQFRQMDRLERDGQVLLESLALFTLLDIGAKVRKTPSPNPASMPANLQFARDGVELIALHNGYPDQGFAPHVDP